MIYIHYGSEAFDPDAFKPIRNLPSFNKPTGGLWASPIDAETSWKGFVEFELEGRGRYDLSKHFCFRLTPSAKVAHIHSEEDMSLLEWRPTETSADFFVPDFEKMLLDGWDAIELHYTESGAGQTDLRESSISYRFDSWDADSILVLNPKVLFPV